MINVRPKRCTKSFGGMDDISSDGKPARLVQPHTGSHAKIVSDGMSLFGFSG